VVVVEGDAEAFAGAVAEVRSAGWRVIDGFSTTRPVARSTVGTGPVLGADEAAAALLLVLEGGGIVALANGPRDMVDRLVGDLRHLGPVDHRRSPADRRPDPPDDDAVAILRLLAEGRTLGDAAHSLGLSRRTADRRLADARRALDAERTVEAIAKARRLGWLG
jgi:DNA-binding NarL/FixJ family response regulator